MFQHGTASCVELGTSAGLHDLECVPGWLDFAIQSYKFAVGLSACGLKELAGLEFNKNLLQRCLTVHLFSIVMLNQF